MLPSSPASCKLTPNDPAPRSPSSQAAVVGATTVLLASPAFAATIKLGGDNGELGFFVSAPYRRSHSRRTRVRPRPIAAASKSGCHSAEAHLDTSASGRQRHFARVVSCLGFSARFFFSGFFKMTGHLHGFPLGMIKCRRGPFFALGARIHCHDQFGPAGQGRGNRLFRSGFRGLRFLFRQSGEQLLLGLWA